MSTFGNKTTWADAFDNKGLGGLLGAPLTGPMGGFGRFLLVLRALSIVANNIPNMRVGSFSKQTSNFALTLSSFAATQVQLRADIPGSRQVRTADPSLHAG